MKNTFKPVFCLLMTLLFAGCVKETKLEIERNEYGQIVFTADIASAEMEKTYLERKVDGTDVSRLSWADDDAICVDDRENNKVKFVIDQNNGTSAHFVPVDREKKVAGGPYHAYYPYSLYNSTDDVFRLPHTLYEYNLNRNTFSSPMYAESKDSKLQFNNLCGLLEVKIIGRSGVYLLSAGLTSDALPVAGGKFSGKPLSGKFIVDDNGNIKMEPEYSEQTLWRGFPLDHAVQYSGIEVELNPDGVPVYFPVPPETYEAGSLHIYIAVGRKGTTSPGENLLSRVDLNKDVTVEANKIYSFSVKPKEKFERDLPSGLFSVDKNGKKVTFSPGNSYLEFPNFRFEANQYDFRTYAGGPSCIDGYYSSNGTLSNDWGLFGWSSTSFSTASWGLSTSVNSGDYAGSFFDWGIGSTWQANPASAPDIVWRTLTSSEWVFLLARKDKDEKLKWCSAEITGMTNDGTTGYDRVKGLVLLPDDWTTPHECPFNAGGFSSYTKEQWSMMENAGAVFLPKSGVRRGASMFSENERGCYWTPSKVTQNEVYYLSISGEDAPSLSSHEVFYGCSVRLVSDVIDNSFSVTPLYKVRFAKSNLYYNRNNGELGFENNAYDRGATSYDAGHVSHFYFSSDIGVASNQTYNGGIDGEELFCKVNFSVNNDTWQALDYYHWDYLLNQRKNALALRGRATVKGVTGYVLLPDSWSTPPENLNFVPSINLTLGYERNNYTDTQWSKMEAAGAVFLPCSGYRDGFQGDGSSVAHSNIRGLYWTSSGNSDMAGWYFNFNAPLNPNPLGLFSHQKSYGCSVRLVQFLNHW